MTKVERKTVPNELLLGQAKALVAEGKSVTVKVRGVSMLPFIVGDRDSVRLERYDNLSIGDIVLAEITPGHYVLHRIVRLVGEGPDAAVTLMGDGNICGKEHCLLRHVVARATVIYRNGMEVNPYSAIERKHLLWWNRLLPIRRWVLAVMRRTVFRKALKH